jgi:hypothetical protein
VQIDYMLTIPMLQETRAAAGTSIKVHVMYMIGLKLCELVHRICKRLHNWLQKQF